MQDENYNSKSLVENRARVIEDTRVYNLFDPKMIYNLEPELKTYVVGRFQDGRIDLVLESMYGGLDGVFENLDIILFLNNLDNPLNVREGMVLVYPAIGDFADYRYDRKLDGLDIASRNSLLGTVTTEPNKSRAIDPNRSNYLNKVAFPPTINQTPKPGVVVQDGKFLIGGIG